MSSDLLRIFDPIPSSPFSAVGHFACSFLTSTTLPSVPMIIRISHPSVQSRSIHTRRPTLSDSFELQFVKARSSMALQTYLVSFSFRAYPHKWKRTNYFNPMDWIQIRRIGFSQRKKSHKRNILNKLCKSLVKNLTRMDG